MGALDDASPDRAVSLMGEAPDLVAHKIVEHERDDETCVNPRLAKFLHDGRREGVRKVEADDFGPTGGMQLFKTQ